MIAGFKSDVGGAALETILFLICEGMLFGFVEGDDFGVVAEVVFVPAFADDLAGAVEDDAADGGVGRGNADAATGQVEGALHPVGVFVGNIHVRARCTDCDTKKCNRSNRKES